MRSDPRDPREALRRGTPTPSSLLSAAIFFVPPHPAFFTRLQDRAEGGAAVCAPTPTPGPGLIQQAQEWGGGAGLEVGLCHKGDGGGDSVPGWASPLRPLKAASRKKEGTGVFARDLLSGLILVLKGFFSLGGEEENCSRKTGCQGGKERGKGGTDSSPSEVSERGSRQARSWARLPGQPGHFSLISVDVACLCVYGGGGAGLLASLPPCPSSRGPPSLLTSRGFPEQPANTSHGTAVQKHLRALPQLPSCPW